MPTKVAIIETLGESGLLLPELVTRGLAANDRLKYYLTLLQTAQAHASAPRQPAQNLRAQREASGVGDASLDLVVEASVDRGGDTVYIPGACAIVAALFDELRRMLQPLRVAGAARSELRGRGDIYERRLEDLIAHAPPCVDDQLTASTIKALTRLSGNGHDTLHQLVIDLHWELNRLQASVSIETLDGARVYNLPDSERPLLRAFMRGINETFSLKFDHPGLGTTATHEADRLTIQNDLGLTQAHVVVIHAVGLSVTITYTDVHHPRLLFFQDLLHSYEVKWASTNGVDADYEMTTGQYAAESPEQVERFLMFLGSRLVFLIDWNRARKRLTRLVGRADAVGLLKWAAENNIGHMAFMKAGDVRLIETALVRAAPLQMPPAARLDEWLGAENARLFLMSVLRTTSSGLSAGHSLSLIEDEVEADLLRHLQVTDRHLFGDAAEHAVMISALAERVRSTLMHLKGGDGRDEASRTAALAHTWTTQADEIVRHAGRWLHRQGDGHHLQPLLREADSVADALEETAFLLTLVPSATDPRALSLLGGLADLVGGTVGEYVRCLEESRDLSTASVRSEVDGFLLGIDRLVDMGRQARTAKRAVTERLLHGPGDFHEMYVVASVAHGFERAATALSRCGPIIRDHVLSTRLGR